MYKKSKFAKRLANITAVIALMATSVLPAIVLSGSAQAAQLTSRSIDMSDSKAGASSVTYTVTYTNASTATIKGIIVEFCTTALIGTTCTVPTGAAVTAVSSPSLGGNTFSGTYSGTKATWTNATGYSATAGVTSTSFTLTATNSSTVGSFYGRILTYSTTTDATNGSSASPGSNNVDTGSVAMSTTNDITVTGTVTETLGFCVGSSSNGATGASSDIQTCASSGFSSAATVGLGIISTSSVTATPVAVANGGTNTNGAFSIKTNAIGGATVGYMARQNQSSGKLKITGASCTDNVSAVDGCINSAGATKATLSGEGFGMNITSILYPDSKTGSGTSNLVRNANYDGTASKYAWVDTNSGITQIASSTGSSTKVMDYEVGVLTFGAIAAPTTPSGSYTVSATFVATGTF